MQEAPKRYVVADDVGRAKMFGQLAAMPMPFVLTIKAGEESRRDQQNRLSHRWYADVGRSHLGITTDDARAYSKLRFGVAILREDDAFRDTWDRLIRDRYTAQEKLELMLEPHDYPVTRLMLVKQMTAYMDAIHQHWSGQGVHLTNPEDLKWRGAA